MSLDPAGVLGALQANAAGRSALSIPAQTFGEELIGKSLYVR